MEYNFYKQFPQGYVQIPRSAFYKIEHIPEDELKHNRIYYYAVMTVICQRYNLEKGYAYPSQTDISKQLQIKKQTVIDILKHLEIIKCLKIETGFDGKCNRYFITDYKTNNRKEKGDQYEE